jgi:hypothetical protein
MVVLLGATAIACRYVYLHWHDDKYIQRNRNHFVVQSVITRTTPVAWIDLLHIEAVLTPASISLQTGLRPLHLQA